MLESIFKQKAACDRHRDASFLREREQYLVHLHQQGTSINRIRIIAGMLLNVVRHLEIAELSGVEPCSVEVASRHWVLEEGYRQKKSVEGVSVAFRIIAFGWLRFHNALAEDPDLSCPYGHVLPEFIRFISGPKAMTRGTVVAYKSIASRFLHWVVSRRTSYAEITLIDVSDYIVSLRQSGMKPRSVATVCRTLRSLFRFTEWHAWTPGLISAGISSPSVPRYDPNPRGPSWRDVRRMLSAKTEDAPADLRASAILFLFAVYGLRSIEVSSLLVSDFDWREEVFTLRRAKGGRTQRFPIQYEVGEALIKYLTKGRPPCKCRNVFVTLIPPFRAMTHSSLRHIVAGRMKQLHIESALYSTHALRHSCATQLLHKGISMEEIARFLGHQNSRSVSIYAKCSKASVKEVSEIDLSGLL